MLRTLSVTVAAAALALVSMPASAVPYSFGNYSEQLTLSPSFLDQGRRTLTATGNASLPSPSSSNPQGTVRLPVTDTDFTPTGTGDFVPGTQGAAFASGFAVSTNGNTVEFRNITFNEDFNTLFADIIVNGVQVAGAASAFDTVNSITGQSFMGLAFPVQISFTDTSASILNAALLPGPGNGVAAGIGAGTFQLVVPEPAAFAIFGLGLGLVGLARRRRAA